MTFGECKDKTSEYLSFGNYSDVQPKPNIANLVQEAYREVATEAEFNWVDTTFATVVGTAEYTLTNPPDWIRITDVLWGTTVLLYQTDPIQLRRLDPLWTQASNAQPFRWFSPSPNVIRLYPPPSSIQTVYAHGSRAPAAFAADSDLPAFPLRYHECLPLRGAWLHLKKVAIGEEYQRALKYRDESRAIVADLMEERSGQEAAVSQRRFRRQVSERLYLGSRIGLRY